MTLFGFPCLFHDLTGLNCMTCGATRAVFSLLRGDVMVAVQQNALIVLLIPFVLYQAIALLLNRLSGKQTLRPLRLGRRGAIWLVGLALAFMIVRNLPIPAARFLNPP